MLDAQNRHAIKAKTTASGRDPPANATPAGIDAAMAAPGAISVTLWKRTSRSPIASRLSPGAAVVVVLAAMAASDVVMPLLPGWSHGGWRPWQAQTCSACGTIAACVATGPNPAELDGLRSRHS